MRDARSIGIFAAVLGVSIAGASFAAPAQMRAIVQAGYGGPQVLKLQMVPVPEPGAGEVRVKVYAAAVNPTDWRFREGEYAKDDSFKIAGFDFAGVIDAVGAGVTQWKPGDAVFGTKRPQGAYAEYLVTRADGVIYAKPKNFTYEEASGITIAGMTALRAVVESHIAPGQRFAIVGAAGGVGSAAVQIAKARGVSVITIASSSHDKFLRALGADTIVAYDKDNVAAKVKDVDVVLNTALGQADEALAYVKRGGMLYSVAGLPADSKEKCAAAGVTCFAPGPTPASAAVKMSDLIAMAEAGRFKVSIEKVYPLEQAAAAQEANRSGHAEGKLILSVTPQSKQK